MSNIIDFNINNVSCSFAESSKSKYNAQKQEVNDLMEILRLEQNKYLQQKILVDLIEDIVSEEHVENDLKTKIKSIILSENLKQTITIDNKTKGKGAILLGVDKDDSALTYFESNSLRDLLKIKLSENVKNLAVSHEDWVELIKGNRDLGPLKINADDKVLLEYRQKLTIEQEKYVKNLMHLHELLEDVTTMKVTELPVIMEHKVKECQVKEKINHLKFILAQEKCRIDIFTETNCSLKAYKELIKEIKEQQRDCHREIENLMEMKEKYKHISGKQYYDILKSYLQYKSTLDKKKTLYNSIKN